MLVYFDHLCCGLPENVFGLSRKNNIATNASSVKHTSGVFLRWIEKDHLKEFKREIELTLTLKPEKQVPEFLVLQTGSKINDQPGEVLFI